MIKFHIMFISIIPQLYHDGVSYYVYFQPPPNSTMMKFHIMFTAEFGSLCETDPKLAHEQVSSLHESNLKLAHDRVGSPSGKSGPHPDIRVLKWLGV